jgi:hypothetical protein
MVGYLGEAIGNRPWIGETERFHFIRQTDGCPGLLPGGLVSPEAKLNG